MRTLLSIDPGGCAGLALWRDGVLVRAWCSRAEPAAVCIEVRRAALEDSWDELVIEAPEPQPGRKQRARAADVLLLARRAGALAEICRPTGTTRWIGPSAWKGSVPKPARVSMPYIIAVRAQALLTPAEFDAVVLPRDRREQWDVWDAIGVGLVALGRARRGLVR